MNETATKIAEQGATSFFAAMSSLDPAVQLVLLTLTAVAATAIGVSILVVFYVVKSSNAVTEKVLAELRNSSTAAQSGATAIATLQQVVAGVDRTLQANTIELARAQGFNPSRQLGRQ